MKYLFTILLALLALVENATAQKEDDSLRSIINSRQPYQQKMSATIKLIDGIKDFDSTIELGIEAINTARKHTDSTSIAELKLRVGLANYFKGNYDVAAKNYFESIQILENSNEPEKLAPVYNELAKLYRKTKDLDKADQNYVKAEKIYRTLNDTTGIAMILNESGVVYEYRKDYKEAVNRYTTSMKLAEKKGDSVSVSYSLSNIAGVYVIEKKYDEAEKNLLRALAIRVHLKDSFGLALTYSDLGAAMSAKGDLQKAIDYLNLSNKVAVGLKYPELQSNNYNELSLISKKQGDFQKAFDYFMLRTQLRDSLMGIEKTKQIEELNTKYETAKREQKIDEQQNKINQQNFLFIGIAAFVVLASLLAYSSYKRFKFQKEAQLQVGIANEQALSVKAVIQAEESERQRIAKDLHDSVGQMMSAIKMNLSAIESELNFTDSDQKNSFDTIINLVDDSCREVRTVSHIMMPNALLKNNLGDAVRDFVNKLNHKDLITHVYTEGLDVRIDTNVETVLYRILQECVSNAIKHALATTLDISLVKDEDGITATIEDNGQGFDSADIHNFEGIGLKSIIARIVYLKGSIDFDTAPGRGTVIALYIPIASKQILKNDA